MAFTMAEILLSLTIIGVVAAITLPSLTGNINERTWNTQRKALYARFSQAIALMPSLNGYGSLSEGNDSTSATDTAAETFVTEGLSKVLKINNICDSEHLEDCGLPTNITDLNGSNVYSSGLPKTLIDFNDKFNGSWQLGSPGNIYLTGAHSQINTKVAAFETQNGESIAVYYNPYCAADMNAISQYKIQPYLCANFVYDLNGNKGPNTVGKDIGFITALYATDSIVVAPIPINKVGWGTQSDAISLCKKYDSESRPPNIEELMSLFYNKSLIGFKEQGESCYWSSTKISPSSAKALYFSVGIVWAYGIKDRGYSNFCVKR